MYVIQAQVLAKQFPSSNEKYLLAVLISSQNNDGICQHVGRIGASKYTIPAKTTDKANRKDKNEMRRTKSM